MIMIEGNEIEKFFEYFYIIGVLTIIIVLIQQLLGCN